VVDALIQALNAQGLDRVEALEASRRSLVAAQAVVVQDSVNRFNARRNEETIEFTDVVARRLQEHRKEANFTQANLATAMQRCGYANWTRVTVAEVEGGARKVSLDELLTLAALYAVPMVEFLVPNYWESVRRPLGEVSCSVLRAMIVGPSDGPEWAPSRDLTVGDSGEEWRPAHGLWATRSTHPYGILERGDES